MKTLNFWRGGWKWAAWLALATSAPLHAAAPADERAVGTWQGALEVQGTKLRLAVHVQRNAQGALTGTLDSIDQGTRGIPIDTLTVAGDSLQFTIKVISGSYRGDFAADNQSIAGNWTQGPNTLPLNLRRDANLPVQRRPQEPARPLPYAEEEVTYDSAPGVKLAATLTLPPGRGPFPAVVLITGSGPQDRDEALAGHRPFYVLADALTRRGIAVLRADDRGVGKSTGDTLGTSEDFARDALAGVRYLLQRPRIDAGRIGLLGHSEGGLIAPLAVTSRMADADKVAFLVLLAGPGVPLGEILVEQQRLILGSQGVTADAIASATAFQQRMIQTVRSEPDNVKAAAALQKAIEEYAATLPEVRRARLSAQSQAQIARMTAPWMRWILAYDPAAALAQVRVPVLALFGARDLQVPPAQNRAPVETALARTGIAGSQVQELPGLNHLFQAAATGSPSEYGQIEETMNPAALEWIGNWVLARGKRR